MIDASTCAPVLGGTLGSIEGCPAQHSSNHLTDMHAEEGTTHENTVI